MATTPNNAKQPTRNQSERKQAGNARRRQRRDEVIRNIARDLLFIETLETRDRDALDFHEVAVWQVRKALEAAFAAGQSAKA